MQSKSTSCPRHRAEKGAQTPRMVSTLKQQKEKAKGTASSQHIRLTRLCKSIDLSTMLNEPRQANLCLQAFRHDKF